LNRTDAAPAALRASFALQGPLGSGSRGVVWAAQHRETQRTCAIKTLQRPHPADAAALKSEYRTLVRCAHPNIIAVHRLVARGHSCWFEMDFCPGVRITRWAEALGAPWTDTHDRRFRAVAAQLAAAVSRVHTLGLVHRDIKPENLLVDDHDHLTLLDFDLSGPPEADAAQGRILGTPGYRPPEQALGLPFGPPADWFSVGSVFFEMLVGQAPFGRRPRASLRAQRRRRAPDLHAIRPDLPADITRLVHDLLQPEPLARPSGPQLQRTFPLPSASPPTQHVTRGTFDRMRQALALSPRVWVDVLGGTADHRRQLLADTSPDPSTDLIVRVDPREQVERPLLDAIAAGVVKTLRRLPREVRASVLTRDRIDLLDAFSDFALLPELSAFSPSVPSGAVAPLALVVARLAAHTPVRVRLEDTHAMSPEDILDLSSFIEALPADAAVSWVTEGDSPVPHSGLHRVRARFPHCSTVRVGLE
jgi:hypothetical protein